MATQQFDVFVEHASTFTRLNLVVFSGTVYNLLHAAGEYMAVVLSETDNVIHSEALDTIFDVKAILKTSQESLNSSFCIIVNNLSISYILISIVFFF